MSDTAQYDDIDDPEMVEEADNLADLRRAAKENSKARREADGLKRELALLKAGVDTDSAVGKMFAKGYEGELTKEAVTAAWSEISPNAEPPAAESTDTVTDPAERAATQERTNLASGVSQTIEPTPDPREVGRAAGQKVVADGGSREDGMATHFQHLVAAAIAGDKRVIVPGFGSNQ